LAVANDYNSAMVEANHDHAAVVENHEPSSLANQHPSKIARDD